MKSSGVTVVVTSFNHACFLPDALQSLRTQSTTPYEVVLVDDGSTDDTAQLVSGYPEVRYLYQPNRGLSAARNAGLRASVGEFIVFLDADDVLEPRAIEVGLRYLAAHPDWALVSGGHRRAAADLRPLGHDCCWPVHDRHYRALLHGNYIGMHAAVMYRRAALLVLGGFDEELTACEDYDVYLRMARSYPIGCHGEIAALYRQHGTNMSARLGNMLAMALRVHDRQYPHVKHDPELRAAWRQGHRGWWIYFGDQIWEQVRSAPGFDLQRLGLLLRVIGSYPFAWKLLRNSPLRPRSLARRVRSALRGEARQEERASVNPGSFRTLVPLGSTAASDSVASRYIHRFLAAHPSDAEAAVDIGDGPGQLRLEQVSKLADASQSSVTCILQLGTFELDDAVGQFFRVLRPGGVLLAVLPGVVMRSNVASTDDHWRFTAAGARRLFSRHFGEAVEVSHHGNVVTALGALHQLPADSLEEIEFEPVDNQQQLLITVFARKIPVRTAG
ncbi:MAG: glycosyl transferase family 2 [Bryobacterales bacterium]|nr:glycosyl transferase family 2 [Bryobacterales bacterium]